MSLIPHLHTAMTLYMTGFIWFVQIVHYPLKVFISEEDWIIYERMHTRKTLFVTLPFMLIELASLVYITVISENPFSWEMIIFQVCTAIVWISTLGIQVPIHGKLEQEYNLVNVHRLIKTNWIRTIAWSIKAVTLVITWML